MNRFVELDDSVGMVNAAHISELRWRSKNHNYAAFDRKGEHIGELSEGEAKMLRHRPLLPDTTGSKLIEFILFENDDGSFDESLTVRRWPVLGWFVDEGNESPLPVTTGLDLGTATCSSTRHCVETSTGIWHFIEDERVFNTFDDAQKHAEESIRETLEEERADRERKKVETEREQKEKVHPIHEMLTQAKGIKFVPAPDDAISVGMICCPFCKEHQCGFTAMAIDNASCRVSFLGNSARGSVRDSKNLSGGAELSWITVCFAGREVVQWVLRDHKNSMRFEYRLLGTYDGELDESDPFTLMKEG